MIKYLGNVSPGTPFETGETRTVNVTAENLSAVSGFENDIVTYTATVLDSAVEKLPATFQATLKLNGTDLVIDQVFDAVAYSQVTGELSFDFTVPSNVGAFDVTLNWIDQII